MLAVRRLDPYRFANSSQGFLHVAQIKVDVCKKMARHRHIRRPLNHFFQLGQRDIELMSGHKQLKKNIKYIRLVRL